MIHRLAGIHFSTMLNNVLQRKHRERESYQMRWYIKSCKWSNFSCLWKGRLLWNFIFKLPVMSTYLTRKSVVNCGTKMGTAEKQIQKCPQCSCQNNVLVYLGVWEQWHCISSVYCQQFIKRHTLSLFYINNSFQQYCMQIRISMWFKELVLVLWEIAFSPVIFFKI